MMQIYLIEKVDVSGGQIKGLDFGEFVGRQSWDDLAQWRKCVVETLSPLAFAHVGQNPLWLDVVMLQLVMGSWRRVAPAGTDGSVIHLIDADGSAVSLLMNSPLFAARRHPVSLLITVSVDDAVSAVIRTAGIRVQWVFRTSLPAVLMVMVLVMIVMLRWQTTLLNLQVMHHVVAKVVRACIE